MNKLKIDTCPLCGSRQLKPVWTCTDHYASGETFELYRCVDCGFLLTQGAPVAAEIGKYYETPDYISHSDTRKGLMNRVYHGVRQFMLLRKAQLVERTSGRTSGSLLDIGTGTGYFPHTMQQRGWQIQAIEKSAQARAFARNHFGLDVKADEVFQQLPADGFDVITMWHVMEHLEPLNETWIQLRKLLKARGVLVLAVPNPASYDAQKYGKRWAAYDVPRHLWHFTPEVMRQWGAKHGFRLLETHPMPLDAFYVSMLTERYQGCRWSFVKGAWMGLQAWLHTWNHPERSSSMIYVFSLNEGE